MKTRLTSLWLFVLALLLVGLACSSFADLGLGTSEEEAAPVEAEGQSEEELEPSGPGPETLDLNDPNLYEPTWENYLVHFQLRFDAPTAEAATVSGSTVMEGEYTQGPPVASKLEMTQEGYASSEGGDEFLIVEIGDSRYVYSSEFGCVSLSAEEFPLPFDTTGDINDMLTAPAQQVETGVSINGVLTDRYLIDESNINTGESVSPDYLTQVNQGDLYVSQANGTVVRVVVQGRGISESLSGDPDLEGDYFYQLDYEPVEDPLNIQPPATCSGSDGSDYPQLDDAYSFTSLPGYFSYKTNHSFDEVLAFYKSQMAAEGWTLVQETAVAPTGLLLFTRDEDQLTIAFTEDTETGAIDVVIGEEGY